MRPNGIVLLDTVSTLQIRGTMKTSRLIAYGIAGMIGGLLLEMGMLRLLKMAGSKNRAEQQRRNKKRFGTPEHVYLRSYLTKKHFPES